MQVTDTNVNSTVVSRDASGNFLAGTGTFNTSIKVTDGAVGGQVTLSAPVAFTSYALKLPSADGSSNQVLKTDGSGNLGWASLSSTGYINGGNSFGANATIGLNDAYRLDFKTSNTAQMTINASGNVGIGTTSPSTAIAEIRKGSGTLPATSGSTSNANLRISTNSVTSDIVLDMGTSPTASWMQSVDRTNLATNKPLFINPNGGNVAIGTTTVPTAKLQVSGGQAVGAYYDAGTGTAIDFNNGNLQKTTAAAGAITLSNLIAGGSYTLILDNATGVNTTGGTFTLSAAGYTFRCQPECPSTQIVVNPSSITVVTITATDTLALTSWIRGF